MKRVVVTGLGIVSSIGNNAAEVTQSLKDGKSGIEFVPQYKELGFRSQVAGTLKLNVEELVDRRLQRFMGDGAAYAYLAMKEAIADAGLSRGRGLQRAHRPHRRLRRPDHRRHRAGRHHRQGEGPQARRPVPGAARHVEHRLGQPRDRLQDQGPQLLDQLGLLDLGALHRQRRRDASSSARPTSCSPAAARNSTGRCRCCSTPWAPCRRSTTTRPTRASRAYDKDRDGFVISGGGGILVLEELEVAKARGAKIYAEVIGYGATSDGADMVAPSGEGAVRCMKLALDGFPGAARRNTPVDYINTHGTSTPVGDITELDAIRAVFGDRSCRPSARPSR